ncbi:acyl-CoA dehydrogenase family protein [Novosphingobium sp. KCTC 2891]|uniref:acyl-CoA dehydrogenase family protein n=1 Tax=Novosphingobium sp. KCTC 2891 TaxID=2989730 RepID=UPI002221C2AA|nr:acyl-CoA dehydrogenase family protein [Novosphingobium sp. KCTC 2891]MCW1383621.1 acyl-CoA dehydrogenase family protein [Novosphingobium sp. KCTC 2891]
MTINVDSFPPVRIPEEAEALRPQVKAFIAQQLMHMPPHRRARTWAGFDADFSRALAAQGWVGLTMPKEYGGAGLDAFSRFVLVEELLAAGAPVAAHWIGDRQSAPLLLHYGTEAQREFFLPRICRGELFFCIGMSEPNSGSDLASVRTRAEKVDGGWKVNGQKIWTTYAHKSHYMIALVRTSGTSEDRQAGLSQFLIDLSLPGVTVNPIKLGTGDTDFNEVFFEDVILPEDALVGTEGNGWAQVNAELAFERSGPERIYSSLVLLDLWSRSLKDDHDAGDLERLGLLVSRLAPLRNMSIAMTGLLVQGKSPVTEAALFKDMGTEVEQAIPADIADALGARLDRTPDPELMRTLAYLMQLNHVFSLRGGTREILRGMIARGLGLR